MNNIIIFHRTTQAKAAGVRIAATLAAERLGLTPTQCAAVARKACDSYRAGGKSPARVVADARREMRGMASAVVA